MKFKIQSRITGSIIFELETSSIRRCVEAAVKSGANLSRADLSYANLPYANLSSADLSSADLSSADLSYANLYGANLSRANLSGANLSRAELPYANLSRANLSSANLSGANLSGTKNMVKTMGVEVGNFYWKRFDVGLNNNGYQFKVGLNKLRKGEVFADDERETCKYPAFHFASKSWSAVNYPNRPLEALIQIPKKAKINEPWTTDGKASADMINIIKVYDTKTGKEVTRKFKSR
jgi:uncharacterized protein YjbI with pentapeptide repeats